MGAEPLGALSLVTSVINMATQQRPKGPPDRSKQLEAERKAQEEEQRKKEAAERKRDRDKVVEARSLESKRKLEKRSSLLANGSAGLADEAAVAKTQLKTKLGE